MEFLRMPGPRQPTLLLAAAVSIALWFIPFAGVLSYPFRIFVTFIHEGGHAVAALLTGNSVQSLSVAMNASGETYTTKAGCFLRYWFRVPAIWAQWLSARCCWY